MADRSDPMTATEVLKRWSDVGINSAAAGLPDVIDPAIIDRINDALKDAAADRDALSYFARVKPSQTISGSYSSCNLTPRPE